MAIINATGVTEAGVVIPFVATAAGGDEFTPAPGPNNLVLIFNNTGVSATTVTLPAAVTTFRTSGGVVAIPSRTVSVAAGTLREVRFDDSDIHAYLNSDGRVPVTYTTHQAGLQVAALSSFDR
jgi:hypothetical protein